jgi:hypothetical protein
MYLAVLHVTLDLEPEVAQSDREKVLRALRDRVRSHHGARVTVRTDDDSAIAVAFLDDNWERVKSRLEELADSLDNAGQARLLTATKQVFAWHDGIFVETAESRQENGEGQSFDDIPGLGSGRPLGGQASLGKPRPARTIVYAEEEDFVSDAGHSAQGRGLSRKQVRIPTRK